MPSSKHETPDKQVLLELSPLSSARCACGNPARPNQRSCWKCNALHRRRYKHSDLSPEAKLRANARRYANVYIQRGKLVRGACEVCGDCKTQPHHDDYTKPLVVRWLCREHNLAASNKTLRKAVPDRW